jgi:carbonic anhydrase
MATQSPRQTRTIRHAAGSARRAEHSRESAWKLGSGPRNHQHAPSSRLDPAKYAGRAEGDAHVIRNAGGRATDDAIRSLVISHKLLGTQEWFVIHHTNCGMELFADEVIADLLEDDLSTASFDGKTWSNPHHHGGHAAGHFIKWHTIKNQSDSVTQDVRRIREHPLVPANVPVYGYVYDVRTGRLDEVKVATEAGRAAA